MPVGGPKSAWIESARCFSRGPTRSPICRGLSRAPRPGPQPLKKGDWRMEGPAGRRICGPGGLPHGGRAASCETAPRRPFFKGPGCAFGACAGRRPESSRLCASLSIFLYISSACGPKALPRRPRGPPRAGRNIRHTQSYGMPRGANLGLLPNYCGWDLPVQFTFTSLNSCSSKARLISKPSTLSFTAQASALCQTGIITLASAR